MGIGQTGLLRPAAWPVKAWSGLIKFRPGSGLGLFFKPVLINRPDSGPQKKPFRLTGRPVKSVFKKTSTQKAKMFGPKVKTLLFSFHSSVTHARALSLLDVGFILPMSPSSSSSLLFIYLEHHYHCSHLFLSATESLNKG